MKSLVILSLVCVAFAALAEARFAPVFTNNMVLQRGGKVPVWGSAAPGETVTVFIDKIKVKTVADQRGSWKIEFPELPVGGPYVLILQGATNRVELSNVLVGDVWFCSGQSNMEWRMNQIAHAAEAIKDAQSYPNIRIFQTSRRFDARPQQRVGGSWEVCNSAAIGKFSAVAYFFGRELYKNLNVPIGLINSSWGGTRVESWTAPHGFAKVPALRNDADTVANHTPGTVQHTKLLDESVQNAEKWLAEVRLARSEKRPEPVMPEFSPAVRQYTNVHMQSGLYNGMVHPFLPMAIRGVIWYQGCANRNDGSFYRDRMQGLYESFQQAFHRKDLPFYFVQLAPYQYDKQHWKLPLIWEAQARFARNNKAAHMAVINDIGNIRDIHPRDKEPVGMRLARLALCHEYGKKELKPDFPEAFSQQVDGKSMKIVFRHVNKFKTADGKDATHFELAGIDGAFHPATAKLGGNTIELTSEKVTRPYMARFAWSGIAEPNLRNEENLPVGAFRIGEIPELARFNLLVPEAKNFQLIFRMEPYNSIVDGGFNVRYSSDYSRKFAGKKIKRIGYCLMLNRDKQEDFVFASMKPFAPTLEDHAVPTAFRGKSFQCRVKELFVKSNVSGVAAGTFAEGNIEFWPHNYRPVNQAKVPGASDTAYDFGDEINPEGGRPGYGSMQIHNFERKQTVMAYNNWRSVRTCDLGIGSAPGGSPDWTFSKSGQKFSRAELLILAEFE